MDAQQKTAWYQREWFGRLVLLLVMAVLLYLRFPDMLPTGNGKVIEPYGDGYKSYTVIAYHAKYDSTYSHFEGMNYPYGEQVVPAAAQPSLSNTLKLLKAWGWDLTDHVKDLVHYSILLGLLLCAFFLYLIFRRLQAGMLFSIVAAIGITFLSPQFDRILSHYSLAHAEVIPILLYLLMRYGERPNLARSLIIMAVVFYYALVHFYFFAIMAFTISFFFLFWLLQRWRWRSIPIYALHYTVQILIPFGFFHYWMNVLDPVDDRSSFPWGFFAYRGRPEGTFISDVQPHLDWLRNEVLHVGYLDYEAFTYIGLVAVLGLAVLLIRWIGKLFRIKPVPAMAGKERYLNTLFFAATVIVLFAFGLPFTIHGLDWLLEYAGPIRQFRSIARFVWVFYYVSNIIIFTWLYHWLKEKSWAWAVWGPALAILCFEAYQFAIHRDLRLDPIERDTHGRRFTDIEGINYDDYQAIITIPYCSIGSDQIAWPCEGFVVQNALTLSVQTGLPTTSAMLTRTSISQTYNQFQLVMEPYRLPALLEDLPNDKPFLVFFDVAKFEEDRARYEHLLEGMRLIYAEDRLRLYEMPVSSFRERIENRKKRIRRQLQQADSLLYRVSDFWSTDSIASFVYESFDDRPAADVYLGAGAYQGNMGDVNLIWDGPIPNQQTQPYRFHLWLYVGQDRYSRTRVSWEEYVPETGEAVHWRHESAYQFFTLLDSGWALLTQEFTPKRTDTHFRIFLQNEPLERAPIYLDELLILPAGQHLYRETEDYIWMDDRWFAKY